MEYEAVSCAELVHSIPTGIAFSAMNPADIVDRKQLERVNEQYGDHRSGMLTERSEISAIILSRPSKRSCGDDGVPYCYIKRLGPAFIAYCTILFNQLIANAYFPRSWKHGRIIAIPKNGKDSSVISNWRPISQLNSISKIFERLLADRLTLQVERCDIFQNQFGFLAAHSAEHAVAKLQSDIMDGLNTGRATTLVALDMQSAFDTMWHNGLIMKMSKLGINPILIKTVQSMLMDRTFSVQIDGYITGPRGMVSGIPQGSVLGPPCFNLFTHDIPTHPVVKNIQFADDTSVYETHCDPGRAQNNINIHLARLDEYFHDNKLLSNTAKTELLNIVGTTRDTHRTLRRGIRNMRVSMGGKLLTPANNIRLLGVQFQQNAKFTRHVDRRLEKARRAYHHVARLLRNRHIPVRTKSCIYKLYVRPIVTFGAPVWCRQPAVSSHQMERLRRFERKCLRSAANIRRERGTYRHISASRIYELARCPRIDRFVAKRHIQFYTTIHELQIPKLLSIIGRSTTGEYHTIDHMHKMHLEGRLFDANGQLRIFNRRLNGPGIVYSTKQ